MNRSNNARCYIIAPIHRESLWNTLYMETALEQVCTGCHVVHPDDVARLSPLLHRHINFQGRYAFVLAEAVARGEFRPLRNPDECSEEGE